MKIFRSVILLLLQVSAFCPASAQVLKPGSPSSVHLSGERLERIDKMINLYITQKKINGAVALIARDGKIAYEKAFGLNDVAAKQPMKTDHIFRIASQTKAITSVAVMMLFEEGKFLLDDPISKYLPAFAKPQIVASFDSKDSSYTSVPAKREITIRDLLTYTSGIDYPGIGSDTMKAIYAKAKIPAGFVTDKKPTWQSKALQLILESFLCMIE